MEDIMAKARKARRGAKRPAKKKKRTARTAKVKARKVAKPRRSKARAARARPKGVIEGAIDAVREATTLRRRMDRNTFEGQ
jgi:hypothetical protein